jgi:enolase
MSKLNKYDEAIELMDKGYKYDALKQSHDRLLEVMHRIDNWAKAYPLKVFPEPTQDNWKQAAEVLKANGLSLDRISASNMRHVLDGIKEDVEQAIVESEK